MAYQSTESLGRSSRMAGGSRSNIGGSVASSRPFLNLLNPMGRHYRGYQHPEEHLLEEEEDEDEDEGRSAHSKAQGGSRAGGMSWGDGTEAQADTHNSQDGEGTTESEEEDEIPQSFMIEAGPRKSGRRSSTTSHRKSAMKLAQTQNTPPRQRQLPNSALSPVPPFSVPPRPSELTAPAVMPHDLPAATAFASTRPKRGLDDYERALWNWVNVYNLDAYLQEVYAYYVGKGIYCIALSRGLNLLTVGFVISFSTFLLGCVNYKSVPPDGIGRLSDIIVDHCVSRFSGFTFLFFLCFGAFYLFQVIEFVRSVMRLVDMYKFYTHLLNVPDADIQTISWPEIVRRISQIRDQNPSTAISSNTHQLDASAMHHSNSPPTAILDAHDIANRIMRQENYLIALFNKDLLDLHFPLPALLERLLGGRLGGKANNLTQALEWNLRYCLLGHLFDGSGRVRKAFLKDKNRQRQVEQLRRRFIFMGMLNAIFAPFIVLYLLMYSFFRYFEEYHKNPSSIGGRQYTPYAQWKFREFNELPHVFRRRLDESYPVAGEYIDQFPKEKIALIMRFVAFVAGSFAAVLALATVWDPEIFVHFEITPHRTVVFYLGVFGSVLAGARGMVPDAHRVFDPELLMREVISYTHYMPNEWKGQLHSQKVQVEFAHLFEMRISIFAQELLSVIMTPFVLWYTLPPCAPAIIDFFREFTVHVDGLGYVCSFAVFDFKRHGNVQFGAPTDINDERMMSKEGKMEKSFLNFKAQNPEWIPSDPSGSVYLSRLADLHQNASPSVVARAHSPLNRLRSARSRSGRSFTNTGGYGYNPSPFAYPDPPASGATMALPPTSGAQETRLAERALAYERALQKSVSASMARKTSGRSAGTAPTVPSLSHGEKGKGPERSTSLTATDPDLEQSERVEGDQEIHSELGDSYVHGVQTRGPRLEEMPEGDDEELGGGMMNLLAQIYSNQRRAVG